MSGKKEAVSGEAIIEAFLSGDVDGIVTYEKLCKAIDLLNHWQPQAVVEFLGQFLDIAHLLDHRCKQLVLKFAKTEWFLIPTEIRPQFVKFLRDIGVQHICHTETIIRCFVEQLLTRIDPVPITAEGNNAILDNRITNFELRTTEEEQESIFKLSLDGLVFILKCFPVAAKRLLKIIRQCFPHYSVPYIRYVNYVRNLIFICEDIPQCRGELFSIIIDGLCQIDAVLRKNEYSNLKKDHSNSGMNVFIMDEEYNKKVVEVQVNNDRVEKLDSCMCYMFTYIAKAHRQQIPKDIDCDWLPSICEQKEMFEELLTTFEEHILMAHDLRNIPFLWFYICSIDTNYQKDFLNWLWSYITRLNQAPNDWKKAQGAACYIGSILSRASYIDLKLASKWLETLLNWCTTYVNEMIDRVAGATIGTTRHGTFYAVFQAFLIAFCFRYREIVQAREMDKVHHWGLGHVVHSTLEPLSYISRPVALCFATISRSLQLVYVNHVLPTSSAEKLPFEPQFPFDSYYLPKSLSFISMLTRRFSPLAEDTSILKSELLWKNANEELDGHVLEEYIGSWEFLEDLMRDQNELGIAGEPMDFLEEKDSFCKTANEFLTIYSTSAGLQQFKTHFEGVQPELTD